MTRVKVCGITREADLLAAVAAGADAVGVVVDVPVDTPREIPPSRAVDLVDAAPPFVTTVLVTMPDHPDGSGPEPTADLARRVGADALQVHGEMTPDDLASLSAAVGGSVGGVGSVVMATDAERAPEFADVADALLVDSLGEQGRGGTGETHDWERTRSLVAGLDAPVVLAGGLTPENVAEAVATVHPYAVDVASGVEREGGVKDHDAVTAFVREAQAAATGPDVVDVADVADVADAGREATNR